MRMDRLIGILSVLLQEEKVTAPELARRFEVSRRTINRDIEVLCRAGIPVVTERGQGGGISIVNGYRIDRTLLTPADMQAILTGLRGLGSVSNCKNYRQLMEKLSAGSSSILDSGGHILIDLSSWYRSSLVPKIELIQKAIGRKELFSFFYHAPDGKSERVIEPYLLVFQWASWYVWGWCTKRQDWRLFKLNRMTGLRIDGIPFKGRPVPPYVRRDVWSNGAEVKARVRFDPSVRWRLIDEYGPDLFVENENGTMDFTFTWPDVHSLFRWLLSFGDKAELLEPEELRAELCDLIARLCMTYKV